MKVIAKPGLEMWKLNQVLLAALTLPQHEEESLDDYAVRVMADSREQGRKACDRGTLIHGELEKWLTGGLVSADHVLTCKRVYSALDEHCGVQEWAAEKSFACDLGYGGKCDLHSKEYVVDFKTKEFDRNTLPSLYDEHYMQLAAYRYGLGVAAAKCAICFVSTTHPLQHIVDVTEEDLERGFTMFRAAVGFWQAQKKYKPIKGDAA
jgi:hypothetical protein